MRIDVAAPEYVEVAVHATVHAIAGADTAALARSIADTLTMFFSPIDGGPDGTGWPFGRDVFRAEILRIVRGVSGVDYVEQLGFVVDGCNCHESCGNVCIGPIQLVASGAHEIEVS
jgi:hypothetical protein